MLGCQERGWWGGCHGCWLLKPQTLRDSSPDRCSYAERSSIVFTWLPVFNLLNLLSSPGKPTCLLYLTTSSPEPVPACVRNTVWFYPSTVHTWIRTANPKTNQPRGLVHKASYYVMYSCVTAGYTCNVLQISITICVCEWADWWSSALSKCYSACADIILGSFHPWRMWAFVLQLFSRLYKATWLGNPSDYLRVQSLEDKSATEGSLLAPLCLRWPLAIRTQN